MDGKLCCTGTKAIIARIPVVEIAGYIYGTVAVVSGKRKLKHNLIGLCLTQQAA
jgi:hypothetical protein